MTTHQLGDTDPFLFHSNRNGLSFFRTSSDVSAPSYDRVLSLECKEYPLYISTGSGRASFRVPASDGDLLKHVYVRMEVDAPAVVSKKTPRHEFDDLPAFRRISNTYADSSVLPPRVNIDPIMVFFRNYVIDASVGRNIWERDLIDLIGRNEVVVSKPVSDLLRFYRLHETNMTLATEADTEAAMATSLYLSVLDLLRSFTMAESFVNETISFNDESVLTTFLSYFSLDSVPYDLNRLFIRTEMLTIDTVNALATAYASKLEESSVSTGNNSQVIDYTQKAAAYRSFLSQRLMSNTLYGASYIKDMLDQIPVSADVDQIDEAIINDSILDSSLVEVYRSLFTQEYEFIEQLDGTNTSLRTLLRSFISDTRSRVAATMDMSIESMSEDATLILNTVIFDSAVADALEDALADALADDVGRTTMDSVELLRLEFVDRVLEAEESVSNEYEIPSISDRYDLQHFTRFYVYNSNWRPIAEELIDAGLHLSPGQLEQLRYGIEMHARTGMDIFLEPLEALTGGAFDRAWLTKYPFYGFETTNQRPVNMRDNFRNVAILHACLSDVFLEESYHEYVHTKKNLIPGFQHAYKTPREVTAYESCLLRVYTSFNKDYVFSRLSDDLIACLEATDDACRRLFSRILTFEAFLEFSRTNTEYYLWLFQRWRLKLDGSLTWVSMPIEEEISGLSMTPIEAAYVSGRLVAIRGAFSSTFDHRVYLSNLATELNSSFEDTLEAHVIGSDNADVFVIFDRELKITAGKHMSRSFPNAVYSRASLSPRTVCTLYSDNYCMIPVSELRNDDEVDVVHLDIVDATQIGSVYVRSSGDGSSLMYKGYRLPGVPGDLFAWVLSSDLAYDLDTDTLSRRFEAKQNLYLYPELMRWISSNDFVRLQFMHPPTPTPTPTDVMVDARDPNIILHEASLHIGDQLVEAFDAASLDLQTRLFSHRAPPAAPIGAGVYYAPLLFWFTLYAESSLPTMALTQTDVFMHLKLGPRVSRASVLLTFIIMEESIRRELTNDARTMVCPVMRTIVLDGVGPHGVLKLPTFQGPVIDVFVQLLDESGEPMRVADVVESLKLKINGKTCVRYMDSEYNTVVQQWQKQYRSTDDRTITLSFSLHPRRLQPSGSINWTTINDAVIKFKFWDHVADTLRPRAIRVAHRSYRFMHIVSGQAAIE